MLISQLVPINLLEEKAKFFADETYNPQFIYNTEINEESLSKLGHPRSQYVDLAREVVEEAYFGRNELELQMLEGKTVNQSEVTERIEIFLKAHQLQNEIAILWSSSFISRASITKSNIKLRLPADFREQGLEGMIYHEIGTHAIRRINYRKQPWFKKKKQYGFKNYLRTEEGLASLNALVPFNYKSAYNSALRYLAVEFAQKNSFAELWSFLSNYVDDRERRWTITFRQKRGMKDSSQPGGHTKDLAYFEGMIDVWKWLGKNNFDPSDLYWGKMAWQDIPQAKEINPHFSPFVPLFVTKQFEKYQQSMLEIGELNHFKEI